MNDMKSENEYSNIKVNMKLSTHISKKKICCMYNIIGKHIIRAYVMYDACIINIFIKCIYKWQIWSKFLKFDILGNSA